MKVFVLNLMGEIFWIVERTRSEYIGVACRLWNFKACPHKHRYFFPSERILILCWRAKAAIPFCLEVVSRERKTVLAAASLALSVMCVCSLENSLIFDEVLWQQ